MSTPAGAKPELPSNVWIQCGQFSGPAPDIFPHLLTNCVSRQGQEKTGTGQTDSNGDGTETLTWDEPFQKGESLQAINITSELADTQTCPAPLVEFNVSAEVGPGANNLSGSPVRATICVRIDNTTNPPTPKDFVLKPGTFFTIFKK
jgi:hypothetical protein